MKNLWVVSRIDHDENSYDILVGGNWCDEWYRIMNVDKEEDTSHIIVFVNGGRITDMKMSDGYGWDESIELTSAQKYQVVNFLNKKG